MNSPPKSRLIPIGTRVTILPRKDWTWDAAQAYEFSTSRSGTIRPGPATITRRSYSKRGRTLYIVTTSTGRLTSVTSGMIRVEPSQEANTE